VSRRSGPRRRTGRKAGFYRENKEGDRRAVGRDQKEKGAGQGTRRRNAIPGRILFPFDDLLQVLITVEEAKDLETTMEIVEGIQFDRGYLSSYFVTDPERMECMLGNPVILLNEIYPRLKAYSFAIAMISLTERQFRPVMGTPSSLSALAASLDRPTPSGA